MSKEKIITLPILPLRDVVAFPRQLIPLYVGRPVSLDALRFNRLENKDSILLITQKDSEVDNPTLDDLYRFGTIAKIKSETSLPDNTKKVYSMALHRAEVINFYKREDLGTESLIFADIKIIEEKKLSPSDIKEHRILRKELLAKLRGYTEYTKQDNKEFLFNLEKISDLNRLTDRISPIIAQHLEVKQELLEIIDPAHRAEELINLMTREMENQKIEKLIRSRVKDQIEKSHREYYLHEQAKAIQKELGDDGNNEIAEMREQIKKIGMSEQAQKKAEQELRKLSMMSTMTAEATVTRTYLETLLELPWKKRRKLTNDLHNALQILDEDHYSLSKVKERILEHLAVHKRVKNGKAPILCFVGPPGVGKTSLGQSIARATGRDYQRVALGGIRDEAEIRGHRRTYVGSMPGKIINSLVRSKSKNPLIVFDEIDKLGFDAFRGDPSSALLEVLDPEQNYCFADHYLEVDFDLSEVMFIATANSLNIPPALHDRLEIIPISGYMEDEKVHIAKKHLIPKQYKANGIGDQELQFDEDGIISIIRNYTKESGVRDLERKVSTICRKLVYQNEFGRELSADTATKKQKGTKAAKSKVVAKATPANKKVKPLLIKSQNLLDFLGVVKYDFEDKKEHKIKIGQVTGLAWTAFGGEILNIEAVTLPEGTGKIIRTGKLGDVMRESIEASLSVVRSLYTQFNFESNIFKTYDFHVHLPEGAIPKDGPSAGVGITTALLSAVTNCPIRQGIAMTGEITLTGEVLAVGGIKEKLLAAVRNDIKEVILPTSNRKDLSEIPEKIKKKLKFHFVDWFNEVCQIALDKSTNKPIHSPEKGKKGSIKRRAH